MASLSVAALVVATSCPLAAAEREPRGKHAGMVRFCWARAQSIRSDFEEFALAMQRYGGFVLDDIPKARPASEAHAACFDRAAAAWEREDENEARRLMKEADRLEQDVQIWHTRLWEWRRRQAESAPTEKWYRDEVRWQPKGAMAAFDEFFSARRAVTDAWGTLAEATVPGADAQQLLDLREQAYSAEAECDMAEWRMKWTRTREDILRDKELTSPQIKRILDQWLKAQQERLSIRQADIQRDRRVRMLDAELKQSEQDLRLAVEAARQAREQAKSKK